MADKEVKPDSIGYWYNPKEHVADDRIDRYPHSHVCMRPEPRGWVCIKCGASNAPHLAQCPCTHTPHACSCAENRITKRVTKAISARLNPKCRKQAKP